MLQVAKILRPCGLRGEMRLSPYTVDENFWKSVKEVYVLTDAYHVQSVRIYKGFVYLTLKEITSCEQAEAFRDKEIFADESLIKKNDGEFLINELLGCQVVGDKGKDFGAVDSVEKYGSADIINVKHGGTIYSFPFLKALFVDVNVSKKKIIVSEEKMSEVLV